MTAPREPDHELEDRLSRRLLDIFIRAGLVLALVLLCYKIFSPFMSMMLWALILAITIYPLHQMLAARIGGKQGLASTLIVLLAVAVIITPTVMLGSEFADSVHDVVKGVRDATEEEVQHGHAHSDWDEDEDEEEWDGYGEEDDEEVR